MRRSALPLNALRVFDAAARHLSFTRAADELAVTPAAVGQQIRALEDVLGVVLFRRTPRGLELTAEAAAGLPALRAGFLQFEEAVRAVQAGQSSQVITIAAPRDFTAKWLAPRLAEYGRAHPDLRFVLVAADDALDFTEANLDLAIRHADAVGEYEGVALDDGAMIMAAAPGADNATPISWPGGEQNADAALRVGDAGLAIDAALSGFGRVQVPALLAAADVAAGRLQVVDQYPGRGARYWLIAPTPQWRQKKVQALVAALTR